MKPAISVIVAIYNSEKWLSRCLDSLLAQTLTNLEIILIDDGSTDFSGQICDEYADKDARIVVFHKPNSGVSATRQLGLSKATGEYLIFLDSDDYALPEAYQTLYDCATRNRAEIVCCNYYRIEPTGIQPVHDVRSRYSLHTKLKDILTHQNGYLWNHLVSKDLLMRCSITFPEGMNFGEDQFIFITLLTRCKENGDPVQIASCKSNLVYYDKTANPQSLSRLNSEKRFWTRFHWWEQVHAQIMLDRQDSAPFYSRLVDDCFGALWNNRIAGQDLCNALKPYYADIKRNAPLSPQKYLILLVCRGKYAKAARLKLLGSFRIVRDKFRQITSSSH